MKEKIENAIGLVYTVVEALCRLVLIFMVCTVTAQVISRALGGNIKWCEEVMLILLDTMLFSKDVDTPEKHIHSIKNPRQVSDLITALINEQRDQFGIRGRDMVGPSGMPPEAWENDDCCND